MLGLSCRPAAASPVAAVDGSCVANRDAVFTDAFSIDDKTGIAKATISVKGDQPLCEPEKVTLVAYIASGATRETALPQRMTTATTASFVDSATLNVTLTQCGPYQVDLIWGDRPLPRIDRLWEHGGPDYAPSDLVSLSGRAIDLTGPSYVIGSRPAVNCVADTTFIRQTAPPTVVSTTVAPTTTVPGEVAGALLEAEPETLPVTGSDPAPLVAMALGLIAAGTLALGLRRAGVNED
ncbi:MAG: hypothetical protein AB7L13_04625 [Acidimicrobiia bacterium]